MTVNQRALIIDDEPDIRELLEITLGRMNIDTVAAKDATDAHAMLAEQQFDLCLTDMRLPDGSGIDIVRHIQQTQPQMPVAVITAHGNVESAVAALKAGAFDFVSKPVDLQMLRALIAAALKLSAPPNPQNSAQLLIGESQAIMELRQTISKLARSQAPVCIQGESGSGKELVANLIHREGPRADAPFVPVNCGAIPTELMESEFFGHKKGSFTGAVADKQGLFQAADGGTLFLDEVADLPLHMQVKLLRAIQEKAVRPVGSANENNVNVRILSATHKDLSAAVNNGKFREDLFYRINVIQLRVPSLRQRPEDIPPLAARILEKLATEYQLSAPHLSSQALGALQSHAFPGNVRELENILERALTLCEGNTIQTDDLHLPLTNTTSISEEAAATAQPANTATVQNTTLLSTASLRARLDEQERDELTRALERNRWNKTVTAEELGMTYRQLRYRLKKYGID